LFFFSSRRRHTRWPRDWSSDMCSSDLTAAASVLDVFPDLDSLGRWAARGGTGCSLLICVGGDGTLEAAAVAALGRSVPLLPVPCGGDSLFARALGQPGRVDRVVDLLVHGDVVH